MTTRRKYTDADKAAACNMARTGNVSRAASALSVPRSTVRSWIANEPAGGYQGDPLDSAAAEQATPKWTRMRDLSLRVAEEKLKDGKVSGRDAGWIAAVSEDKIALLSGRATSRSEITGDLASFLSQARDPHAVLARQLSAEDEHEIWRRRNPEAAAERDRLAAKASARAN